jgi:uncharacterized protein (TIGR02145 family)
MSEKKKMYMHQNLQIKLLFFFYFLIIQSISSQSKYESGSTIVTDIDGNEYNTITIGEQIWMKENLKVIHYRNGDPVQNVTDDTLWAKLMTGAYCNYNKNEKNTAVYGRLYNWQAVNDSRSIAPAGWHVPTNEEIFILAKYLGGYEKAGGKLKQADTSCWQSPNTGADNSSGFNALPAGARFGNNGSFGGIGAYALFWTSSPNGAEFAWKYSLDFDKIQLVHNYYYKWVGYSIRCIKDKPLK